SERDDAILVHGITLLLGDSGGLVTNPVTPPSSPRHPVSSIAQMMEADAQTACGPRHGRGKDRTAHRWGKTKGKIGSPLCSWS
ncbi:MAG: hypothetical protein ACLP4V_28170, partial [Methylocella sp.]